MVLDMAPDQIGATTHMAYGQCGATGGMAGNPRHASVGIGSHAIWPRAGLAVDAFLLLVLTSNRGAYQE